MQVMLSVAAVVLVVAMSATAAPAPGAPPTVAPETPLWPEERLLKPTKTEEVVERSTNPAKPDRSLRNVMRPAVYVYLPANAKRPTPAVVICPGGGYGSLAIDKEGHDVARWLNGLGVAGVVLKYRLPRPELSKGETPWPLQDAQRALRLVRAKAAEWKIDPKKVGILGFSAGGHLAAVAGTVHDAGKADAADPVERESCRPDFLVLGYPVIMMQGPEAYRGLAETFVGKGAEEKVVARYSPDLQVNAQTPPAFLVHAKDDGVKFANSVRFAEAMRKAGVEAELTLYEKGGHGYGLGVRGGEVAGWPGRCAEWMKRMKILGQ